MAGAIYFPLAHPANINENRGTEGYLNGLSGKRICAWEDAWVSDLCRSRQRRQESDESTTFTSGRISHTSSASPPAAGTYSLFNGTVSTIRAASGYKHPLLSMVTYREVGID